MSDDRDSIPADGNDGQEETAAAVLRLLGLARRSGRLEVGFRAVERLALRHADAVVMVTRDMGASQRRRVDNWQVRKVVTLPLTSDRLGSAMGREKVAVTGLRDTGFIKGITKLGL